MALEEPLKEEAPTPAGPSPAHNSVDCRGLLMCDTSLR